MRFAAPTLLALFNSFTIYCSTTPRTSPGSKKKKSEIEQMADEIGEFIKDAKKKNN
jgi:hypothetical protein